MCAFFSPVNCFKRSNSCYMHQFGQNPILQSSTLVFLKLKIWLVIYTYRLPFIFFISTGNLLAQYICLSLDSSHTGPVRSIKSPILLECGFADGSYKIQYKLLPRLVFSYMRNCRDHRQSRYACGFVRLSIPSVYVIFRKGVMKTISIIISLFNYIFFPESLNTKHVLSNHVFFFW